MLGKISTFVLVVISIALFVQMTRPEAVTNGSPMPRREAMLEIKSESPLVSAPRREAVESRDAEPSSSGNRTTRSVKVSGHVRRHSTQAGVGNISVRVLGQENLKACSASDGMFELSLPVDGQYQLVVDESSIPAGLLVSPEQGAGSSRTRGAPAEYAPCVVNTKLDNSTLAQGENPQVTLWLFESATVRGRVVGPRGEQIQNAWVRLECANPGLRRITYEQYTDQLGEFTLTGILPMDYVTLVSLLETEAPFNELIAPRPEHFSLGSGADQVVLLEAIKGKHMAGGRVVDQDGNPFPDLDVLVYRNGQRPDGQGNYDWTQQVATTKTDLAGCFRFENLPSEQLAVQVAPEGTEEIEGKRLLASWVPPVVVDLTRQSDNYELGTIVAHRSRPYSIRLCISVANGSREAVDRIYARVVDAPGAPKVDVSLGYLRPRLGSIPIQVAEDRASAIAEWTCETPCSPVLLELWVPRKGDVEQVIWSETVIPTPDGNENRIATIH